MDNYIINNKTIGLLKSGNKTIIINVDNLLIINKKIKTILDLNCILYGSSLEGRLKYTKRILNNKYKLPVFINNNIILIQLNSFRNKDCLLIVFNKIIDYNEKNTKLYIKCINNYIFSTNISKYSLEKIMIQSIKLINNINNKIDNFV